MRAIDSSLVICALGAGQAQASYQQVRKFGGQCLRRSLGLPAIWLHAVARTRPEGRFVDIQLIAENMAPDVGAVGRPIGRVRDPRPENPAIWQLEFVREGVMPACPSAGVAHRFPPLVLAEGLMVIPRGSRPGH